MPKPNLSHLRRWAHTANTIAPNLILVYGGYGADYINNPIVKNELAVSAKEENPASAAQSNQPTKKKQQQQHQQKKKSQTTAPVATPSDNTSASHLRDNRISTLALLQTDTGRWSHPQTVGPTPLAREHHSSIALNLTRPTAPYTCSHVFIFGGRTNPKVGLCEAWLLELDTYTWIPLELEKKKEYARWRHRIFSTETGVYLSGGTSFDESTQTTCTHDDILRCDIKLNPPSLILIAHSLLPSPLHSHSILSFSSSLYLYGGIHGPTFTHDHTLYITSTDKSNADWRPLSIPLMSCACGSQCIRDCKPQAVFSHTLMTIRSHLLVLGGCNSDSINSLSSIHALHLPSLIWYRPTLFPPSSVSLSVPPPTIDIEALLCKQGVCILNKNDRIWLVMVGGGGHVFHFNFYFNNTIFIQVLNADSERLALQLAEDPSISGEIDP